MISSRRGHGARCIKIADSVFKCTASRRAAFRISLHYSGEIARRAEITSRSLIIVRNYLPRINDLKHASRRDNGVLVVEPGKCMLENTIGRHDGRSHVLLHRDWDSIDQMDRETQVILIITLISAASLTNISLLYSN